MISVTVKISGIQELEYMADCIESTFGSDNIGLVLGSNNAEQAEGLLIDLSVAISNELDRYDKGSYEYSKLLQLDTRLNKLKSMACATTQSRSIK